MLRVERFGLLALVALSLTLLFFVQPFITLWVIMLLLWFYKPMQSWMLGMFALFGAAFIALINTTKVPDSDLEKYLNWYESVSNVGIIEFLSLFTREYAYYFWMYSISLFSAGDKYVFIFLSSWIPYLILMLSILLVCRNFNIGTRTAALIMLTFLFFAPLFAISAHLLRQFFAAAMVTIFFAKRIVEQKNSWWIIVVATFVHYSAFIFLPLILIKSSRKLSIPLNVLLSFTMLLSIFLVAKAASGFLTNIPIFGLIFQRISAEEIPVVIGLSFNAMIFVVFILALTATVMWSRVGQFGQQGIGLYEVHLYIVTLLIGTIVVVSNLFVNTAEIAMRIYFYLYFLSALVVSMYFVNHRKSLPALIALSMVVTIQFFLSLDMGVWRYAPVNKILFLPVWEVWGVS
jgi:hypothetical protein